MKTALSVFAAAFAGMAAISAAQDPTPAPAKPGKVHFDKPAFDAAATAAANAGLTGVIAVTGPRGELYRHASGPEADAALWPWGSLSKQVAAALAMRLIDQGKLSLDTTIGSALPDFPNPQTAAVTVRQLLMHTSGLPNPEETPKDASGVPSFYTRSDPSAGGRGDAIGFCAGAASGEPGAAFSYNNCDTIVLGAVIAAEMGRQYDGLIRDEIATPAGLTSLRFASPNEHPVTAHGEKGVVPRVNLATFGAGGALVGTVDDVLRFDRALMNGLLVSKDGTAEMWKGDPALGYVALGAWSFETPLAGCEGQVKLVERRGSVDGIQMRNIIAPGKKLALVIFTDNADTEFGEIWQGKGPSYDLASAAFCAAPSPKPQ